MRKTILFILLVIYPILLGTLYGQTRGYTARACGLDMNRNGIIGEAADCNVCDGTTTDVDGDAATVPTGTPEAVLAVPANPKV